MISALKAQNAQVAAGQLGGTPPVETAAQRVHRRTDAPDITEEFSILLKVNGDGSQVRLRDVLKIELGGESL